jgi:CAAX prenyl protease-like protein
VFSEAEGPSISRENGGGFGGTLLGKLRASPILARVLPFFLFAGLTSCQGMWGESSRYWIYAVKCIAGVWAIWAVRPVVTELQWKFSWQAWVAGIGVFVLWVWLDPHYRKFMKEQPWNPYAQFGRGSGWAWFFVAVRLVGSGVIVPPIEEMFYRSFVYRYLIRPDFTNLALGRFHPISFVLTSAAFGLVHREWLAGILCGLIYQGLVIWKNRLGDAMAAHAITNLLLGWWVVWRGAWQFW